MDELSTTPTQLTDNPLKNDGKRPIIRKFALVFNILSVLSIWIFVICIGVGLFMAAIGFGGLFGNKEDVLGLLNFTGFLLYLLLFIVFVIAVVVAITYGKLCKKYRQIAKASYAHNPALFGISKGVVGSIILMVIALILFAIIWGVTLLFSRVTSYISIIAIVGICLASLACVLAIADRIICKGKFNNLNGDEQQSLKNKSEQIKKDACSEAKKKRLGKLY